MNARPKAESKVGSLLPFARCGGGMRHARESQVFSPGAIYPGGACRAQPSQIGYLTGYAVW
ncbi:hypothetical protein GCM10028781_17530 [Nostocoides australiense]